MSIVILKEGWQTQVMDQGRKLTRHLGIPASGVVDLFQYWWANGLTGHTDFEGSGPPVLEICAGPVVELLFEDDHFFALTGSSGVFSLDGRRIESHRLISAVAGQKLRIASIRPNGTVYLAIAGEWMADRAYGSASRDILTPFRGTCGHRLEKQTRLEITSTTQPLPINIETPAYLKHTLTGNHRVLRILAGPEIQLDEMIRRALIEETFVITRQSSRMAYRLKSPVSAPSLLPSMLSVFVLPGMIQWPAGGQPILLLPNCQVTGGYPRVARVIDADLWKLAYCGPGDTLRLKWATLEEALYLRQYLMGQFSIAWNETFPRPITHHSLMY